MNECSKLIMKILLVLLLPNLVLSITEIVETPSGTVIGSSTYYEKVIQFLGIPFAQPPVGNLRFRRTLPVKAWRTPIFANTFGPACFQFFPYEYPWVDNAPGQSEDCLYLNIWAPADASVDNPKAVLFWMYGGGLSYGSNRKHLYNGEILSTKGDVIVVTINYRLGIFGFLTTGSDDAPGNMGLYDALEALKWVNNNIHAFGGDKKRITISGQSVGATICSYFAFSPLVKGLYQQAIMESGSPLAMQGDRTEKNLELGQKVAEAVGCLAKGSSLENNPHVVECLRAKDAKQLTLVTNSFKPVAESTFLAIFGDQFLPTNPRIKIRQGNFHNARILIGFVEDEGSFELPSLDIDLFGPFGERYPRINKSLGVNLINKFFKDFDFRYDVANHYLGNLQENDYDVVRSQVYHSIGDFIIDCPSLYFAEGFQKRGNPVHFYYYTHRRSSSPWASWMGVAHADEVPFVFGRPLDIGSNYTEPEKGLSREVIRLWTNFVKYGVPSYQWREFSPRDPNFVRLGIERKNDDYLESHLSNCEFYRSYFGF